MVTLLMRFAPILLLINSFILGMLSSGYSIQHNTISSLVHEKLGAWQTANFIICGMLTLGLAYYLNGQGSTTINNWRLIVVGAAVLGLTLVLLGIFPADKPGVTTLTGQIHGAIFIVSVLIQAALQLIVAITNMPSAMSWYLLVSGLITTIGLPTMALFPDYRGIIQRIFVGAIMLWITSASFWLKK